MMLKPLLLGLSLFVAFPGNSSASNLRKERNKHEEPSEVVTGRSFRGWNDKIVGQKTRAPRTANTIVSIAREDGSFNTLISLLEQADLASKYESCGAFGCRSSTVFAPNDSAFTAFASDIFTKMKENTEFREHLIEFLKTHIISNVRVESNDIIDGAIIETDGEKVEATVSSGEIRINGSKVVEPFNVNAVNGIIHTMEAVIKPSFVETNIPGIAAEKGLTVFENEISGISSIQSALEGTGPFTVFIPTNKAFSSIDLGQVSSADLETILRNHVVENNVMLEENLNGSFTSLTGSSIAVSNSCNRRRLTWNNSGPRKCLNGASRVIESNILAMNGVIHRIETVLVPSGLSLPRPNLLSIVLQDPDFSQFAALFEANQASLPDLSDASKRFTVFIPTDEALSAASNVADIVDVLNYHIVPNVALTRTDMTSRGLEAANGKIINLEVASHGHAARLNGNTYIRTFDFIGTNGVLHVIPDVLTPSSVTSSNNNINKGTNKYNTSNKGTKGYNYQSTKGYNTFDSGTKDYNTFTSGTKDYVYRAPP